MDDSRKTPAWRGVTGATALGLALAAGLASPAFAQAFLGDWTATAQVGETQISESLHVTRTGDGYAVTANLIGAAPDTPQAGPGKDVVLEGNNFSYKRTVVTPNGDLTITYTGVVSGDSFTAMADSAFGKGAYNGVRVKGGQ